MKISFRMSWSKYYLPDKYPVEFDPPCPLVRDPANPGVNVADTLPYWGQFRSELSLWLKSLAIPIGTIDSWSYFSHKMGEKVISVWTFPPYFLFPEMKWIWTGVNAVFKKHDALLSIGLLFNLWLEKNDGRTWTCFPSNYNVTVEELNKITWEWLFISLIDFSDK